MTMITLCRMRMLCALIITVGLFGAAQASFDTTPRRLNPTRKRLITVRLSLDTGVSLVASQYEGAILRIFKGGEEYSLTLYVRQGGSDIVDVDVSPCSSRYVKSPKTALAMEPRRISLTRGAMSAAHVALASITHIELVDVVRSPAQAEHYGVTAGGPEKECCLTCGGVTVCACAVQGPCGGCCVGWCC